MKESIGGTQLFIVVIALILIFTAIMAFTINHSNAFAVKDQVVSIIEEAGGFDMTAEIVEGSGLREDETLRKIVDSLTEHSYRQVGKCPEFDSSHIEVVGYQRNGSKVYRDDKASFCIVKIPNASDNGAVTKYYYQIVVFYSLDIPIVNELFNFKAVGETKPLYS